MVFEFYPDEKLGDIYQQYHQVLTATEGVAYFMEYRQDEWHAEHTGQKIENYLPGGSSAKPFFCVGNHDQPRIASLAREGRSSTEPYIFSTCSRALA